MDWAPSLAAASTVLTSAKSLYDSLSKKGTKTDAGAALAILEATASLQENLLQAQKENLELQATVAGLRAENAELKAQGIAVDAYEERKVGGSFVLVKKGTAEPYYCPNCAQTKHVYLPIQPHPNPRGTFGTHQCGSCRTNFRFYSY